MAPGQRVLIALSGGPDSVALLHCMVELSQKRDLAFSLSAAHLNHGIRGADADADEEFCVKLCARLKIPLVRAFAETPRLARTLKRSIEESARIARHAFLASAARQMNSECVAVAHHADDRIETVLYRLCRGTGLAGIQGIGWTGPLVLRGEEDVSAWLNWRDPLDRLGAGGGGSQEPESVEEPAPSLSRGPALSLSKGLVVRPMLECPRKEVLAYLKSKRQKFRTDETNYDAGIPRNAVRNLVLPLLEEKVHPGARAALWRLAEEAEKSAEAQNNRRQWLAAFANLGTERKLILPVPRQCNPPTVEELSDALEVVRTFWDLASAHFSARHAQSLQTLFDFNSGPKSLDLPGGLIAERRNKTVTLRAQQSGGASQSLASVGRGPT